MEEFVSEALPAAVEILPKTTLEKSERPCGPLWMRVSTGCRSYEATAAPTVDPASLEWSGGDGPKRCSRSSDATRTPWRNHEPGPHWLRTGGKRHEVHGPQEGRWSRRRRTGPTVNETLGSGLAAQARERRPAGSRRPSRTGRNPWRGGNPREQRRSRRDLSARARRTSGGRKALQPGEGRGGSRAPFEPTARGQERAERHVPSPRREKLRRVNPTDVRGMK